ncbi:hypothetical protein HCH_03605 [Hahella chejuensis KCTC 2396]|uniref:SGNH hydrolase-type esterase domain-containing protein n=2 Tax=Hahella chejuensis TaxID=158327 RepID=Q2SG79_HAHCH|nr:hypothetical protein HCH_03605 [Hahella chejuensis KCTC 2396]
MKCIACVVALFYAVVIPVNIFMDPLGLGWVTEVTDEPGIYDEINTRLVFEDIRAALTKTSAAKVLIGSSRVMRGFDTCALNSILNIGVSTITSAQTEYLVDYAVRLNKFDVILVEALPYTPPENILSAQKGLVAKLISLRTFFLSFKALRDKFSPKPLAKFDCSQSGSAGSFFTEVSTLDKRVYRQYRYISRYASNIALEIKRIQRKASAQTKVIPFIPPVHPDLLSPEEVDQLLMEISGMLGEKNSLVSYSEIYDREFLDKPTLWQDANHFSPELGASYLQYLVQVSKSEERHPMRGHDTIKINYTNSYIKIL